MRFAVVSTSYTAPAATGSCLLLNAAYDLFQGHGLVPDRDHDPARGACPAGGAEADRQSEVAEEDQTQGKSVLRKKAVVTIARQMASARVTWSTKKKAQGTNLKLAPVKTTKAGRVTLRTTGNVKRLYVKLSLQAPAVAGFEAYSYSKKWTVK